MESAATEGIAARYLAALGVERLEATVAGVADLQRRHLAAFTFNSVGPLLGEALPLDEEALFDRIVARGRGGYCFEHNKLFFAVLRGLGCEARLALGRVFLNRDVDPPLTHRVTILSLEGARWLVDVGFGAFSPRVPLRLASGDVSTQGGRDFWLEGDEASGFALWTREAGAPYLLYRFNLNPHTEADCEVGHFYSRCHPSAVFVNNLVVSRILGEEVRSLVNASYRRILPGGFSESAVEDAEALRRLLEEEFGLRLPPGDCERLMAKARAAG
jgi:N-hydroxyarylamine O-acetyltransferase